ncbi:hypothetical protein [Bradyrhizobium liaoningense]|uniref:hypothetical protein n=1 Tax=Bradyrhizobium liaoningense TaxID=43992 RepID=UPI001BA70AC8|nr:hypothetical protein [Bradyrhizobium liaoningense]MBR0855498.1 hypothetical protein [Bradyrhizobium liaoningense]
MRNILKQSAPLRRAYYKMRLATASGQSDEADIIERLSTEAPKTFIEFGFHPVEFNCINLARSAEWRGLLIDGSERQASDARALFPGRIAVHHRFLTLDNLDIVRNAFSEIGVLSIDVDGNDYWFLKELLPTRPRVICVEYNSTFGLESVTIPYDPSFDRNKAHSRGWYHGASLAALAKLCAAAGYGLSAVSSNGINAFFSESGKLDPAQAWRPNSERERLSGGISHEKQRESIKGLPMLPI